MDSLSRTLSALSDPTRRQILKRLSQGETTVMELSTPFDISAPAISRHLRVLESAGLISRGRVGTWRTNRLEPAPLREVSAYLEEYRQFIEGSFDRLAEHLAHLQDPALTEHTPPGETPRTAPPEGKNHDHSETA